jgi:hypothetical protein
VVDRNPALKHRAILMVSGWDGGGRESSVKMRLSLRVAGADYGWHERRMPGMYPCEQIVLAIGSYISRPINAMSITIQLELPEALAKEARASGLLEPVSMGELISTELRRQKAARELDGVLKQVREQPGEPMAMEEIQAEVKAARAERRAREAGR